MNKFLALVIFFGIVIVCFAIFNVKETIPPVGPLYINGQMGEASIKLEVVNNPITRSKGLSNREGLKNGEGMLFVFLEPDLHGFWMKDMKFSIDIIWIDENLKIIGAEKNVSPDTYPASFYPPSPIKYVIETPAGFFDSSSLKVGSQISLESQNLNFEPGL